MATIIKEFVVAAPIERAWDAVRDFGAVHRRLVPGVLVDARLDGDRRTVTFASGMVIEERLISADDTRHRLAYTASGGRLQHHSASIQLVDEGSDQTRLVWTLDILPDEMAGAINELAEMGSRAMKKALEGEGKQAAS